MMLRFTGYDKNEIIARDRHATPEDVGARRRPQRAVPV